MSLFDSLSNDPPSVYITKKMMELGERQLGISLSEFVRVRDGFVRSLLVKLGVMKPRYILIDPPYEGSKVLRVNRVKRLALPDEKSPNCI